MRLLHECIAVNQCQRAIVVYKEHKQPRQLVSGTFPVEESHACTWKKLHHKVIFVFQNNDALG